MFRTLLLRSPTNNRVTVPMPRGMGLAIPKVSLLRNALTFARYSLRSRSHNDDDQVKLNDISSRVKGSTSLKGIDVYTNPRVARVQNLNVPGHVSTK